MDQLRKLLDIVHHQLESKKKLGSKAQAQGWESVQPFQPDPRSLLKDVLSLERALSPQHCVQMTMVKNQVSGSRLTWRLVVPPP